MSLAAVFTKKKAVVGVTIWRPVEWNWTQPLAIVFEILCLFYNERPAALDLIITA